MNIRNLQLFLHLTESRSFSKTAQQMHISPSALSRTIQRLEDELGHAVFIRDNRSVELTSAGQKLMPVATSIVAEWRGLKVELADAEQKVRGKLTLFCSVTASYSHLPSILNLLRQNYPQIEIQLLTGDPAQAIEYIMQGDADIAIAAKPVPLPGKLNFIALDDVSLSLIAPVVSPLGLQKQLQNEINWDEIPFILPESGMARINADKWLSQQKIKPNIYAQVAGHEAIVSMVALGCGVGIAPDVVIENSPMRDKVQRLAVSRIEPLQLGLCCKQSRQKEPLLNALLQLFLH